MWVKYLFIINLENYRNCVYKVIDKRVVILRKMVEEKGLRLDFYNKVSIEMRRESGKNYLDFEVWWDVYNWGVLDGEKDCCL